MHRSLTCQQPFFPLSSSAFIFGIIYFIYYNYLFITFISITIIYYHYFLYLKLAVAIHYTGRGFFPYASLIFCRKICYGTT